MCEQEYWLCITQFFLLFIFKDFISPVAKQKEGCEVQVSSQSGQKLNRLQVRVKSLEEKELKARLFMKISERGKLRLNL